MTLTWRMRNLLTNLQDISFTFKELRQWYNGYNSGDGGRLYNPWSMAVAFEANALGCYWTQSGKLGLYSLYLTSQIPFHRIRSSHLGTNSRTPQIWCRISWTNWGTYDGWACENWTRSRNDICFVGHISPSFSSECLILPQSYRNVNETVMDLALLCWVFDNLDGDTSIRVSNV